MATSTRTWLTLLLAVTACAGATLTLRNAHAETRTATPPRTTASPTTAPSLPWCPPTPTVVAHRGGTERHLENTLRAFGAAGEAGVGTWELDVRFDRGGTPVILHDHTVDRVSPRSGAIAELDATEQRIPTEDGQFVPTLTETLALARRYGAHVLVELKVRPTAAQWRAVRQAVDATVGPHGVTVISFDRETVRLAHERWPDVATGLLGQGAHVPGPAVTPVAGAYLRHHGDLAEWQAHQWHAAGLRVYAWTVDDPAEWARLAELPVDAIITDRPLAYATWRQAGCRVPETAPAH